MGKDKKMKKYFIISGLELFDNNRGTAALGYGAFSFLQEKGYLHKEQVLLEIKPVRLPWECKDFVEEIDIQGTTWKKQVVHVTRKEIKFFNRFRILLPFTRFRNIVKNIDFVAAINGGDGFSDIYNTNTFLMRLPDTLFAMKAKIPVIQLPQTLGPFKEPENLKLAEEILRYSSAVYVRDEKFVAELNQMGVKYEFAKDLSAYMKPEPWDIDIKPDSIGINVSGLCYSNTFRSLSGQFEAYPELIDCLIRHFQGKGKNVYLIPHSYNYKNSEESNDDIIACREAYNRLENKRNVVMLDYDLISPKVKYVISKMQFFVGTRMHANFAAIFTGVPLFGLAYSYKFAGAFRANGLDDDKQIATINNIDKSEIDCIVHKIEAAFNEMCGHNS